MANPHEQPQPQTSTVAACTVTDCVHNEDHECHAGAIRVEVGANGATCATYQPERPRARP
jgi:hypothetical protein